jgi:hypothetical protein
MRQFVFLAALANAALLTFSSRATAQFGPKTPQFVSPEVSAERKITFRLYAPKAEAVMLFSSDIPGKAVLDNPDLKKGLRLVWFGIGKEDFLLKTSQATVSMLKSHSFTVVSRETGGGHTWINWRDYLHEFAPLLFSEK